MWAIPYVTCGNAAIHSVWRWRSIMVPDYLDIPLFPLPNVTFFPQTYLPLHIFEPRYREMTRNALEETRLIGVTLLKTGWQKDYFGHPPVFKTFTVGKIVNHETLAEGKFNIVLQGMWRARLVEEFPTTPYRTARARVLQDPPIDGARDAVAALIKEIHVQLALLARLLPQMRPMIAEALAASPHPLIVANHLASMLVVDAYDRQSILEQDDPLRRLRLLLVQLSAIARQLQGEPLSEELIEEDDR